MKGHDWKRVTFPADYLGDVGNLLKFKWLPSNPDLSTCRIWKCQRCGELIAAHGLMKLRDARRMAKIPFDCDLQMVQAVHAR